MINKYNNISLNKSTQTVLSFLMSLFFIWVAGYFFCDSLIYYEFDQKLNKMIHAPYIIYKHRSEGNANTFIGKFGINAIEDITTETKNKIVVWGDSYVEAHQVNDQNKIPQLVSNNLLKKQLGYNLLCFGVGMGGDSVADYYFDMPKYEKIGGNIIAHFIIITSIEDTLSDQPTDTNRGLFKSAPFRLVQKKSQPKFQEEKKLLTKFGLYFLWKPFRATMSNLHEINFLPPARQSNLVDISSKEETYSNKFLFDSWSFLFRMLKKQTTKPIIFVYCPAVPTIEHGKIITTDKNANYISLLSEVGKKNDITLINATSRFIAFYETTGIFPRGFPNSLPSKGHFNKYGHKIVSELIVDYILSKELFKNGVHPD